MDRCYIFLSKRIIVELTQQGEIAGKELFYKSKLSLTPKRKVASYVGRLCEEGKEKTAFYAVLDAFLGKKKMKDALRNVLTNL